MENTNNIYNLASIFVELIRLAAFPSRKQIMQKQPDKGELIVYVQNKLVERFGDKAAKYFGITWEALQTSGHENWDEAIFDAMSIYERFEKLREHLVKRDIQQYGSFNELRDIVNEASLKRQQLLIDANKSKKQRKLENGVSIEVVSESIESGDNTKIFEDESNVVYRVNTKAGSHALASDTSWCIAARNSPYYDQYVASNLIFYFAIDKTRELTDPYQKMAIRVMKEGGDNIIDIKATRKTNDGDRRDIREVPGYEKFKDIIKRDALVQPEGDLSKVKSGKASKEEAGAIWNKFRSASVEEKESLLNYLEIHYNNVIPEAENFKSMVRMPGIMGRHRKFTDEEISKLNLRELDAATLELIAKSTNDERYLAKLYESNYANVQSIVAEKTTNIDILTKASFSTFPDVIGNVIDNPESNQRLINLISNREDLEGAVNNDNVPLSDFLNRRLVFIEKLKTNDARKIIRNVLENTYMIRYVKNPSEELQRAVISEQPLMLRYLKNPSEEIQSIAVNIVSSAFQYIKDPSERIQLEAILKARLNASQIFMYIKNPSEKVQLAAIKQDASSLGFIENPSEKIKLNAVKLNSQAIAYIKEPSEELQLAAIINDAFNDPEIIRYIKNPSERVMIEAVKKNGRAIKYIINPSEEVQLAALNNIISGIRDSSLEPYECAYLLSSIDNRGGLSERVQLEAVKTYGLAIRHIDSPSEEVQLAAVKQDGRAIMHINYNHDSPISEQVQIAALKQGSLNKRDVIEIMQFLTRDMNLHDQALSENVQLEALKHHLEAIKYIKNPSEQVKLMAVKRDARAICYIKDPSEAVQLAAIRLMPDMFEYIVNPTERVKAEFMTYQQLANAVPANIPVSVPVNVPVSVPEESITDRAERFYTLVKEAGLFEPPPAMVNEIGEWVRSIYAAHTWAMALEELALDKGEVPKGLLHKYFIKYIRNGVKLIDNLSEQKIIFEGIDGDDFTVTDTDVIDSSDHIVYIGSRQKVHILDRTNEWHNEAWADIFPTIVSQFKKWFKRQESLLIELPIEKQRAFLNMRPRVYSINEEELYADDVSSRKLLTPSQVEKLLLIRECKRYASVPKKYIDKAVAKFPVNLNGWKYAPELEGVVWREDVIGRNANIQYLTQPITVILNFKGHQNRTGVWVHLKKQIEVDAPRALMSVSGFNRNLNTIEETLIHELTHLGQDMLSSIKSMQMIKTKNHGVGLPSKKIRNTTHDPAGHSLSKKNLEHSLRDIEFYTNLGDAVKYFRDNLPFIPAREVKDAAEQFVGISSGAIVRMPINHSFQVLRDKAPKKWEKAVKVFWKELNLG